MFMSSFILLVLKVFQSVDQYSKKRLQVNKELEVDYFKESSNFQNFKLYIINNISELHES